MKTHERNKRLRESKTSIDKLALALDQVPDGKHLEALASAILSRQVLLDPNANIHLPTGGVFDWKIHAKNDLAAFGSLLAAAADRGDAQIFRDIAETVQSWKDHKPIADDRLTSFIRTARKAKVEGEALTVRDVIHGFKHDGIIKGKIPINNEYQTIAREIRRWGKAFKIQVRGEPGRPKN